MLDPFTVACEGGCPVQPVNGGIERPVSTSKLGPHEVTIIEVCKGGSLKLRSCVEHALRESLDSAALLLIHFRPWERVVNNSHGIPVSAFKSPADMSHPRHVHTRGQYSEMPEHC